MTTIFGLSCSRPSDSSGAAGKPPAPQRDLEEPVAAGETRTAVFAGGCFWCVESVFEQLTGVVRVVSGYAGGDAGTAHYDVVSAGRTDHAEAVQIIYNPAQISYGRLLQVFFSTHDPTQRNRQGPDAGRQYRSAVFYANDAQHAVATAYLRQLEEAGVYGQPIATALEKLDRFYPAEEYHQDFVARHPTHPYVKMWALPKLQKLREAYGDELKSR
ncbi:peptide-methionine (S)-S-oxide reductase MsrA [bacterium]|nr:peptide-methionine (S)-S-oxide reductase MsrA [bacterium]